MIALANELAEAIETFNNNNCEDDHIDYWEVVDEISDPTNEKEVSKMIRIILKNV